MFERGIGVSPDIKQAIFWYKKAIENGNLLAVMHLDKLVAKKKGHDNYPHINTIKRAIMRFLANITFPALILCPLISRDAIYAKIR